MEGSPNGMAPVLKTGGRNPLEVQLLYPPISKRPAINERYEKELKSQSARRKRRQYNENGLQELIANTKFGSHNEVWIKGNKIEIVGAYLKEETLSAPGAKAFLKACQKDNIPVKILKKES